MLPYCLLVLLPWAAIHVKAKGRPYDPGRAAMGLFFTLLFFLLALRGIEVGRDLANYQRMLTAYGSMPWREAFGGPTEPGFFLLCKLVALLGGGLQWLLAVCAFLTLWPMARVYKRETADPLWTMAIFVALSTFIMLFSGLRQSVAMGMGMLAFEQVQRRRPMAFLLTVVLAMLFHTSAFVLLLLYPLYYAGITKKHLPMIAVVLGAVWLCRERLFRLLAGLVQQRFDGAIRPTGAYGMLLGLAVLWVFLLLTADEEKTDESTRGMRNLLPAAVAIQIFAALHPLAMRMNYYFLIFLPLLVPRAAGSCLGRYKGAMQLLRLGMIAAALAYFFVGAPRENALDTFPYHFFWEKGT